jgi:hypothetical protein
LNSNIGRFAQSPVGQGLIAEAQGKRFKDGFLGALPGAVVNATPLILKALKYAPPTALYGAGETKERFEKGLEAADTAVELAEETKLFSPHGAAGILLEVAGKTIEYTGIGVGAASISADALRGDYGGAADGAVDLAIDLAVKGASAEATLTVGPIKEILEYEHDAWVRITDGAAWAQGMLDRGITNDDLVPTTRAPAQRRTLSSPSERQLIQNVGGNIWGHDELVRAYEKAGGVEQVRMRHCCGGR